MRFSVYNPSYVMPSISTFTFYVNFPPSDCELIVKPNSSPSYAMFTDISISMKGCTDTNLPINY